MKKWEYHNQVSEHNNLISDLNTLGKNGWEVYKVENISFVNTTATYILWCKREVEKTDILHD